MILEALGPDVGRCRENIIALVLGSFDELLIMSERILGGQQQRTDRRDSDLFRDGHQKASGLPLTFGFWFKEF